MKIDLNKPIVIFPDNKVYIENNKPILLKDIINNQIKYKAIASNRIEQDLYKRLLLESTKKAGTVIENDVEILQEQTNEIELVPEDILIIQKWVYQCNLPAFISNGVLDIFNGN